MELFAKDANEIIAIMSKFSSSLLAVSRMAAGVFLTIVLKGFYFMADFDF